MTEMFWKKILIQLKIHMNDLIIFFLFQALMQIYTQAVQEGIKQTAKQAVRQNSRPKSD